MNLGMLARKLKEIDHLYRTPQVPISIVNEHLQFLARYRAYLSTHTPPQVLRTKHQLVLKLLNHVEVKIGLYLLERDGNP